MVYPCTYLYTSPSYVCTHTKCEYPQVCHVYSVTKVSFYMCISSENDELALSWNIRLAVVWVGHVPRPCLLCAHVKLWVVCQGIRWKVMWTASRFSNELSAEIVLVSCMHGKIGGSSKLNGSAPWFKVLFLMSSVRYEYFCTIYTVELYNIVAMSFT